MSFYLECAIPILTLFSLLFLTVSLFSRGVFAVPKPANFYLFRQIKSLLFYTHLFSALQVHHENTWWHYAFPSFQRTPPTPSFQFAFWLVDCSTWFTKKSIAFPIDSTASTIELRFALCAFEVCFLSFDPTGLDRTVSWVSKSTCWEGS